MVRPDHVGFRDSEISWRLVVDAVEASAQGNMFRDMVGKCRPAAGGRSFQESGHFVAGTGLFRSAWFRI